ncbi:hypothetical protein PsAD46_01896 [Pseudovibrio sp. Ad46]|nr:hypothetical protein PsAD46_01896 [Pseudovibrio sp. Ad46]
MRFRTNCSAQPSHGQKHPSPPLYQRKPDCGKSVLKQHFKKVMDRARVTGPTIVEFIQI